MNYNSMLNIITNEGLPAHVNGPESVSGEVILQKTKDGKYAVYRVDGHAVLGLQEHDSAESAYSDVVSQLRTQKKRDHAYTMSAPAASAATSATATTTTAAAMTSATGTFGAEEKAQQLRDRVLNEIKGACSSAITSAVFLGILIIIFILAGDQFSWKGALLVFAASLFLGIYTIYEIILIITGYMKYKKAGSQRRITAEGDNKETKRGGLEK